MHEVADSDNRYDERLSGLCRMFGEKLDAAIRAKQKSGCEDRWIKDGENYSGEAGKKDDSFEQTIILNAAGGIPRKRSPNKSKVNVNITKPRTKTGAARLANIAAPNDDRSWTLVDKNVKSDQTDQDAGDAFSGIYPQGDPQEIVGNSRDVKTKKNKVLAMQDVIDAQLSKTGFYEKLREIIHRHLAVFGTAIFKGPIITKRAKKRWEQMSTTDGRVIHAIAINEELVPESYVVNPFDFFPDETCGENIHNGSHVFERAYLSPKMVRDLIDDTTYISEKLLEVLEEGPSRSRTYTAGDAALYGEKIGRDKQFEKWSFVGQISTKDFSGAGFDVPDHYTEADTVNVCVEIINDKIIKAHLNPLESGEFPYDVAVLDPVEGHWTGTGWPFDLRTQQAVLRSLWRMAMDSGGLGTHIVMKRNKVEPAIPGDFNMSGNHFWFAAHDVENVSNVFAPHELHPKLDKLIPLVEMTLRFIDEEALIPKIMRGEQDAQPETRGGFNARMSMADIITANIVRRLEDTLIKGHLSRYYDYNMQYHEDSSIKGDYEIVPHCSTTLIAKDQQNNARWQALALVNNPALAHMIKSSAILRDAFSSEGLDTEYIFSDQEIIDKEAKMAQAQQVSPDKQAELETKRYIADSVERAQTAKLQTLSQQQQIDNEQTDQEMAARADQHKLDHDYRLQVKSMDIEIAKMKVEIARLNKIDEIKAGMARTAIQEGTKKEITMANIDHANQTPNQNMAGTQ